MATTPPIVPLCPHCGRPLGDAGVHTATAETDPPGGVLLVACAGCSKVLGVLPGQLIPEAR